MSLVMILLAIFLPPVAVALKQGIGVQLLINILLTLIGWLPGVIHAFWVNTRGGETLA
ncbi:MAG: YqaE/Pmp3 family membrane protein [Hyphomonas sp.]|uniref:YqaE/Pmp3 family membrane protein n=1 Tax=Hyphomonas sp. TaxID=87 RepID=UPI0034A0A84F